MTTAESRQTTTKNLRNLYSLERGGLGRSKIGRVRLRKATRAVRTRKTRSTGTIDTTTIGKSTRGVDRAVRATTETESINPDGWAVI